MLLSIPLLWGLLLHAAYSAMSDVNTRIDEVRLQLENSGIPVHTMNSSYEHPMKRYSVDNASTFVSAVHKLGDPVIWVSYASLPFLWDATLRWQNITCSPTYIERAIGQCGQKQIDELQLSLPVENSVRLVVTAVALFVWTVFSGLFGLSLLFPEKPEKTSVAGVGNPSSKEEEKA